MAVVRVTEYDQQARDGQGFIMAAGDEPSLAVQVVTLSAVSQQITLDPRTRIVRMKGTGGFHFKVGANPTATTDETDCAANSAEYFGVQSHLNKAMNKIAFVEA